MEVTENGQYFVLAQSLAIARYLANKFNLAGTTELDRAYVEMYAEQIRDLQDEFIKYRNQNDETIKTQLMNKYFTESLPRNLEYFEKKLADTGTGYLVGDSLTWADIFLNFVLTWLDATKTEAAFQKAPLVRQHIEKISSHPGIADYVKKRPVTNF